MGTFCDKQPITARRVERLISVFNGILHFILLRSALGPYGVLLLPVSLALQYVYDRAILLLLCALAASLPVVMPETVNAGVCHTLSWVCLVNAILQLSKESICLIKPKRNVAATLVEMAHAARRYDWSEDRMMYEAAIMSYGLTPDEIGARIAECNMNYLKALFAIFLPVSGYVACRELGFGLANCVVIGFAVPIPQFALPGFLYDRRYIAFFSVAAGIVYSICKLDIVSGCFVGLFWMIGIVVAGIVKNVIYEE